MEYNNTTEGGNSYINLVIVALLFLFLVVDSFQCPPAAITTDRPIVVIAPGSEPPHPFVIVLVVVVDGGKGNYFTVCRSRTSIKSLTMPRTIEYYSIRRNNRSILYRNSITISLWSTLSLSFSPPPLSKSEVCNC